MTLLPEEKVLYRHENGPVVTTHRVFEGAPETRHFVSIMLEEICSVEVVGRSIRWLFVAAFVFLGLAALFGNRAMEADRLDLFFIFQRFAYGCLTLFGLFLLLWFVTRRRIVSIFSPAGRVKALAVKSKSFVELIEVVEEAKNRRVMLLANISVSAPEDSVTGSR